MRRRWVIALAAVAAVGAAVALALWRPWDPRPGPAGPGAAGRDDGPPPDATSAVLTVVKRGGGPCGVTVLGSGGGASGSSGVHLSAGADRSAPLRLPAPYAIAAVTVERGGATRRTDPAAALAAGRAYELLVHPDGAVGVAAR